MSAKARVLAAKSAARDPLKPRTAATVAQGGALSLIFKRRASLKTLGPMPKLALLRLVAASLTDAINEFRGDLTRRYESTARHTVRKSRPSRSASTSRGGRRGRCGAAMKE